MFGSKLNKYTSFSPSFIMWLKTVPDIPDCQRIPKDVSDLKELNWYDKSEARMAIICQADELIDSGCVKCHVDKECEVASSLNE